MPRLCQSGFIQTHLDYTSNQQSPRCFHIWVAIGVISGVLGRRVWMDRSYYKLYPNLYIILVSPSGVGMKGTALTQGVELIDLSQIPINTLRGKITPTRLISRLAAASTCSSVGDAELMVISREFKVFTKGIIKDSGLIEDLTDLYDCNAFDYETEHGMQQQIKRPCPMILGASTPEWLSGVGAGDLMSGGFGARSIPVTVTKDEREIAWPQKTPLEMELQNSLIHDLQRIAELKGPYYVTQPAKDLFEKWYVKRKALRMHKDSRLDGYYSKKHDQVLKLSMILAATMSDEMIVDAHHVKAAMGLLEENEKTLLFAYSGAAINVEARWRDQVLDKVMERGEVSHADLSSYFYHSLGRKGLREVIYGLLEEQVIESVSVDGKTKEKLVYRFVEKKGE